MAMPYKEMYVKATSLWVSRIVGLGVGSVKGFDGISEASLVMVSSDKHIRKSCDAENEVE